jgi:hypothetical protein
VRRPSGDAEARLGAGPSVDCEGGTAVQEDHLGRRQVLVLPPPDAAAAPCVVDQITISLAGELQKRTRIHHGSMLQANKDTIRPI